MGSITVKPPDEQKKEIQRLVEEKNYPNMSEWVRETIRQRIEEEQGLYPDELKRLIKVREKERKGEDDWHSMEEVMGELGIDESEIRGA